MRGGCCVLNIGKVSNERKKHERRKLKKKKVFVSIGVHVIPLAPLVEEQRLQTIPGYL